MGNRCSQYSRSSESLDNHSGLHGFDALWTLLSVSFRAVRSFEKKWLSAPVLLANSLPVIGRLTVP